MSPFTQSRLILKFPNGLLYKSTQKAFGVNCANDVEKCFAAGYIKYKQPFILPFIYFAQNLPTILKFTSLGVKRLGMAYTLFAKSLMSWKEMVLRRSIRLNTSKLAQMF